MYIKSEDIYHFREYLIREEKAEETISIWKERTY